MNNPMFSFSTVKRTQCKASILIEGLSGRGKSGLALVLAKGLAGDWKDVFAIDTENGSLKLFDGIPCTSGDKFEGFQYADFKADFGFKPTNYMAFREAAIEAGAKVLIQDSITHAWSYSGGILDMVSELKKNNKRYERDSYAAWGDDEIVKEKQLLYQMFRDNRCHVISTVRVKEKMEYDKDDQGKTILRSLGEQEIMQNDVKYEPDLVLHMIEPGSCTAGAIKYPKARVIKSRYRILDVDEVYEFTPQLVEQLRQYLEEGADPDEILEQQRQDYVKGVKEYLDANSGIVPVWKQLKKDKGYETTKLEDMPLDVLKELLTQLTS